MAVIHPILFQVMRRYPDHKDAARELFAADHSFRELCRDYERCCKVLLHWKMARTEDAAQRHAEYDELLRSLEDEIILYLNG